MEIQNRLSQRRELVRVVRELGAYGVVATDPILFHPTESLLVAVVDARCAGHGEQQDERVREVRGVLDPARDARDVVVAHERQRHERVEQLVVARDVPRELMEVAVVDRAPDRLPQLVLRHGVEP